MADKKTEKDVRKERFMDDGKGGIFRDSKGNIIDVSKLLKNKDDKKKKKKSSLRDQAIRLASERPTGDALKKALITAITDKS